MSIIGGLSGHGTDKELTLEFIEKTLKDPYRVGIDGRDGSFLVVSKEKDRIGNKEKYLAIVINDEGSITTAYPKFWNAIKREVGRWIYESE